MRYMYTRTQLYKMVSMYIYIYSIYVHTQFHVYPFKYCTHTYSNTVLLCNSIHVPVQVLTYIERARDVGSLAVLQHPAASCSILQHPAA
jgi:hypothetical protein